MASLTSSVIIFKQPSEIINVSMDFTNWVDSTITLSSPVVTSESYGCDTSDLLITNVVVSVKFVNMTIASGTDGNRYRIEVLVSTDGGETLEGDGILKVSDR